MPTRDKLLARLRHGIKMDRFERIGVSKVLRRVYPRIAFSHFRPRYTFVSNRLSEIHIYPFVLCNWSPFIHLNERGENRIVETNGTIVEIFLLRKNCERVRLLGNHREPSFQFFSKRERKRESCNGIAFEFVNFERDNLSRDFKVVVSSLPRWRREDIAFNNNNNNWPSRGPAICSAQIAKSTNFPSD